MTDQEVNDVIVSETDSDGNTVIASGLRADIMRKEMESKNTLTSKGGIYVGLGTKQTGDLLYKTAQLQAGADNTVLMAASGDAKGLKYGKITDANLDKANINIIPSGGTTSTSNGIIITLAKDSSDNLVRATISAPVNDLKAGKDAEGDYILYNYAHSISVDSNNLIQLKDKRNNVLSAAAILKVPEATKALTDGSGNVILSSYGSSIISGGTDDQINLVAKDGTTVLSSVRVNHVAHSYATDRANYATSAGTASSATNADEADHAQNATYANYASGDATGLGTLSTRLASLESKTSPYNKTDIAWDLITMPANKTSTGKFELGHVYIIYYLFQDSQGGSPKAGTFVYAPIPTLFITPIDSATVTTTSSSNATATIEIKNIDNDFKIYCSNAYRGPEIGYYGVKTLKTVKIL